MDTRFWGPGAWNLLHTITYHTDANVKTLREFFELIPYILPCKFCRASLTDYYDKEPPTFRSSEEAQEWLYRIHNLVNGKLRGQGLLIHRNPTYDVVKKRYTDSCGGCDAFPAWDFLYSIAYNHPLKVKGSPMPGWDDAAPTTAATDRELNRWNVLDQRRRFEYWCAFWKKLPDVLPRQWREAWLAAAHPTSPCQLYGKRTAVSWIWNIRCKFDATRRDPYREVCSRLVEHSSGCSKSKRARTCRKKR
jgi:hypothetical protein